MFVSKKTLSRRGFTSAPIICIVFIFLSWIQFTSADVSISKPLTGDEYSASSGKVQIAIEWEESNSVPKLTDIKTYTFTLCSGPNSDIHPVAELSDAISASDIDDHSYTVSIDASAGADGSYYIQIYATSKNGYTIHYTNRFKLTDMTGSYKPSVGAVSTPPDAQTSIKDGTQTNIVSIDSKSFTVPYTLQTGVTRYAPMQLQPGATVTKDKSNWERQYATSSVSYFKSVRTDLLKQQSTLTPGWSYIISSAVNWASPAPSPSAVGWYAANERLTRSPSLYTPSVFGSITADVSSATSTS